MLIMNKKYILKENIHVHVQLLYNVSTYKKYIQCNYAIMFIISFPFNFVDDEFLDMPVKLDFLPVQTTMEEPSMVAAETVTKKETAKERKQREKREKKETKRRRSTLKKQKGKSASQQNEFW